MTGPAAPARLRAMRRLRATRVDRAAAALSTALAGLSHATTNLRLAEVAVRATVARRVRSHARLYREMVATGIGATGMEAAEAAMEDLDAAIVQARRAAEAARLRLETARARADAARTALADRQREMAVWDRVCTRACDDARRAARGAEARAEEALAELAAGRRP